MPITASETYFHRFMSTAGRNERHNERYSMKALLFLT